MKPLEKSYSLIPLNKTQVIQAQKARRTTLTRFEKITHLMSPFQMLFK